MGKITIIQNNKGPKQDRVHVYIDGKYCISIRERTWAAFNLKINDDANCEDLIKKEKFIWKQLYGQDSWEKEKVRLHYVSKWLKKYIPNIDVRITGFGANTTELIEEHPEEKGEPDMQIMLKNTNTIVLFLEVTGTEHKRGSDYWIRPDKIDYIQNHPNKDIWVALHYADTKKIIWIKPLSNKKYNYVEKNLKGVIEYFVIFDNNSEEVKTSQEFKDYLDLKVQNSI